MIFKNEKGLKNINHNLLKKNNQAFEHLSKRRKHYLLYSVAWEFPVMNELIQIFTVIFEVNSIIFRSPIADVIVALDAQPLGPLLDPEGVERHLMPVRLAQVAPKQRRIPKIDFEVPLELGASGQGMFAQVVVFGLAMHEHSLPIFQFILNMDLPFAEWLGGSQGQG